MTKEPDEHAGEEAQDDDSSEGEQDRPTVAPPFDPVAFAKEVLGGKPSPSAGTPAAAKRKTPLGVGRTTPLGVGRPTPLGVGRPPMPTLTNPEELEEARRQSLGGQPLSGRPTPQGLLSMANARVPSNLPPRNAPMLGRNQSTDNFAAVDREWEELATSPPPPMQQELIDSITRGDSPASTKNAADVAAAAAASQSAVRTMPPDAASTAPQPPPTPAPPPPAAPVPPSAQEMNDRVSLGDYTGALEIAEKLLVIDPDNEQVSVCAESCRGVLRQMYTARIGPLDRVPMVMVARDQLRWLSIDHRAGFVLSLIDGVSSLEMILDVTGMPELDALRILSELAQQRIISFR